MRIGLDLGGTKIEGVLLDGEDERARLRIATPVGDYEATLDALSGLVARLEAQAGVRCSVGIGTPGSWVAATGVMKNCNSTVLNGRPLLPDIEHKLARPVRLANDADCLALSEALLQPLPPLPDDRPRALFAVILGTGVGGGIVVDGRLLTGPNGLVGEWGHNPLPRPAQAGGRVPAAVVRTDAGLANRDCYCGRRNCIECWLSGPAFERSHRGLGGAAWTPAEIVSAATVDSLAREVLTHYLHCLARALAGVINLLDPQCIVLGGGMSRIDLLYTALPGLLADNVFDSAPPGSRLHGGWHGRVVPAIGGDSSGVLGAARLWPGGPGVSPSAPLY